jgi:hypothetical protein
MRYQRSAPRRRVLPPSLRSRYYPTPSHVRYPNKVQWSMIWIAASVCSLVLLGMILATHC